LVFIVYPKAVSLMPGGPIWSVLFFFMVLCVAVDSQFVCVEGFVTAVMDQFEHHLQFRYAREIFSAAVCLLSFLLGLCMVTEGGIYMFLIFDYYSASGIVLLTFCFFEVIAISWVYGVNRWYRNIEDMVTRKIGIWLKICWTVLTPGASLVSRQKRL
jgi:SNF family Na+-dependent transporter